MNRSNLQEIMWSSWPLALWVLLATPFVRVLLESLPVTHMLIQMPLLIIVGAGLFDLFPKQVPAWLRRYDPKGLTSLAFIVFTILFWMIPRNLDASIDHSIMEVAKFLSLPIFAGLAIRVGWAQVGPVLRSFVMAQFIAMLAFLGWVYIAAPIRICNNYLENEQQDLGWMLLFVAIVLSLYYAARLLFGTSSDINKNRSNGFSSPLKNVRKA